MKIYNATSSKITILYKGCYKYDKAFDKYVINTMPIVIAKIPSDLVLTARLKTTEMHLPNGIPVYEQYVTSIDKLPKGFDAYIVTAIYASALKRHKFDRNIYILDEPVYTRDGLAVIGYRGLCKLT